MVFAQRTVTYTPDSVIYAQTMLEDRHVSPEVATDMDRTFFATQFAGYPSLLALIGPNPPQFYKDQAPLFVSRPLYPYLASLLFDRLNYRALPAVSSSAYVGLAIVLFLLLCAFGPAWLAAVITIGVLLAPISYPAIYDLGTYALTDLLALLLSSIALLAQIRYTTTGAARWLIAFIIATIALSVTRPAIYLVDGAALAVVAFGWLHRDRTVLRRGLTLTGIALVISAGYFSYVSAIHAPGLNAQMHYYYERHLESGTHKDAPVIAWYVAQVVRSIVYELGSVFMRPLTLATVAVGLTGLFLARRIPEVACLIGATLSLGFAVLGHPVPGDQSRTIEVPMIPILAVGIVCTYLYMIFYGSGIRFGSEHICLMAFPLTRRRLPPSKQRLAGKTGVLKLDKVTPLCFLQELLQCRSLPVSTAIKIRIRLFSSTP